LSVFSLFIKGKPMTVVNKSLDENSKDTRIKTILLADDDEFVRDFTKTVLIMSGYSVIDAIDGEDALLKYELYRKYINLLIFDICMPKRNGYETYKTIAMIDPHVKAIFISGYTNDFLRRQDIINRGLVLVSKPFSPKELIQKIHRLFIA
jgi:CheY-like chemotaxis protein